MRKYFRISLVSAAAVILCGCLRSPAGTAADKYYTALEQGDAETAVSFFSDSAGDELENFRRMTGGIREMVSGYGLEEETVTELDTLLRTIVSGSYKSHSIKSEEKISDTEYLITAEAEVITDESSAACLNALDYDSFYSETEAEREEILQKEGEEAARRFTIVNMIHALNRSAPGAYENAAYETNTFRITMIREGEDWKIAGIEKDT